jgi:hypothetical protein
MKIRFELLLNLAAAAVTIAAEFGIDPLTATLLLAAISVGLAVSAGLD